MTGVRSGRWEDSRPSHLTGQVCALVLVVLALAFCTWWRVSGGHWERVETPSMGRTAPVGSLVWVEPLPGHDVQAGEIVTFHAPDRSGRIFTHRVTAVAADGSFSTAGDLSGPDQWRVPAEDVVGRARWVWPGAGWVVRAAPILAAGALVTWGVALLHRRDRAAVALVGAALTVSVVLVVYRPLTAAEQLDAGSTPHGARVTFVGTGLLPVRLTATGARPAVLSNGEAGTVDLTHAENGLLLVSFDPVVPWWVWTGIIVGCFGPALLTLARRRESEPTDP